jgi:hypothetical protein
MNRQALLETKNIFSPGCSGALISHAAVRSVSAREVQRAELVVPLTHSHDFSQVRAHSEMKAEVPAPTEHAMRNVQFRSARANDEQEIGASHNTQRYSVPHNSGTIHGIGAPRAKQQSRIQQREPSSPAESAGPGTAKPCSPAQLRRLKPVLERARFMAFRAFFGLQALLLGSLPQSSVERQLRNHFHVGSKSDEAERVLDVLRDVYVRLSGGPLLACASANDPNCEQFGAYVAKGYREIFLCQSFFDSLSAADHDSPWVILHEAAHLSGAGSDHAYFFTFGGAPSCDDLSPLATAEAVDNADSYAFFAYCVSR